MKLAVVGAIPTRFVSPVMTLNFTKLVDVCMDVVRHGGAVPPASTLNTL